MKRILTTGSFDIIHHSHIEMLKNCKSRGDYLIVGLSTDKFHIEKGKSLINSFDKRKKVLESIRYVDLVVAENDFQDKQNIITKYFVDLYCIGSDWMGTCSWVSCPVEYIDQFDPTISTTKIKKQLGV